MRLLDGLDPLQRRAVVSDARPLGILAGAGSGKTRVLTRRIAHRVLTGSAEADHVLALTFTRKAAGELGGRLAALGVGGGVTAGTFHAVAYAQLRRRWADRGERPPTLVEGKARLLAPLLPRARAHAGVEVHPADLAAEIEWAKARMVVPASYEAEAGVAGRRPPVPLAVMAAIYERYEHDKRGRRLVDFDDLLAGCALALEEDPEFAAAQRWRFRHLFVDEFQDVNPAQFRLLRAWLGDRLDLCVVGDPDQAVYSWNGADPTLLTGFGRHFPTAETVRLERNYRSTPQVLAVAIAVLGADGGSPAGAVAVRPAGPLPVIHRFDTDLAEAQGVARALRRGHRPGASWSEQAVLGRTNAQLVMLAHHLRRAGIPSRLAGGAALLRQPAVRAALDRLRRSSPATPLASVLGALEAEAAGADAGGAPTAEARLDLEALARLGREYLALDPGGGADGFVAWLGLHMGAPEVERGGDAVDLMTFHRAKGLEWPVVFVVGLEQGLVPIGHADTPDALAEEHRLLHVALTRALDQLHCTWAERRTFGGRPVARTPSPSLERVQAAIEELATRAGRGDPETWRARIDAERTRLRTLPANRSGPRRRPGPAADPGVVASLRAWRAATARATGVPAHVVLHDATLAAVAEARPATRSELLALPGVGPVKAERYGDSLLALLAPP